MHADLYVSDRFTGWRERVLTNLSELYSQQSKGFPQDVSQQMVARVSLVQGVGLGLRFSWSLAEHDY